MDRFGFLVLIDPRTIVRERIISLEKELKTLYGRILSFSTMSDFAVECQHRLYREKISTILLGVGSIMYAEKSVNQLRQLVGDAVPITLLDDHLKFAMIQLLFQQNLAGYLTLHNSFDDCHEILRLVLEGKRPVSLQMGQIHLIQYHKVNMHDWINAPHFFRLSNREAELFRLLVNGDDLYVCGEVMGITVKSAENLKTRLMHKLNVHSTARLILLGVKYGLGPH